MNAQSNIQAETLLGALALALPKLEAAKKNSANPHFKSKYADLGSVIDAIQPIADHGLWFRQVSHEAQGGVSIETLYIHASGELSAGSVFVPADKGNAQAYGSAQTYARRYGLLAAFGLATEDDDGNAAAAAPPKQAPRVIDDAQWSEIIQLIEATNTATKAFCTAYKIGSIRDLSVGDFARAKDQLERKLAKMTKENA